MTAPVLKCAEVSVSFGGVKALSGVNIDVHPGEILGILGPNGAGKTTLFNAISGHVVPDGGSISFKGALITRVRPDQIFRMGLARTFQLPELVESITVRENVLLGAHFSHDIRIARKFGFDARALVAVDEALRMFELTAIGNKRTELTNLFERKLVMMASAYAAKPALLLLDEPVGGLVDAEIDAIVAYIRAISATGTTILLIEHVMRVLMELSHRVIVFNQGHVLASGRPEEIRANSNVQRLYFGKAD
jgi:ABC-type branched-subunit amino acid transport system ATPase component